MMLRVSRYVAVFLLLLVAAASPTYATDGAGAFIQKMGEQAVATVNAKNLSPPARADRFRRLFHDAFAVPVIARFVLGQYWRRATQQERAEYLKLFEDWVVQTFTQRFNDYQGISFRLGEMRPVGKQEELVATEILRPGGQPPIHVQWRVHRRNGDHKIVDVIAEGVSMLISQRDEFGAIIAQNGGKVAALIDELRRRTGKS